jgi:AmmeMemoRadiSam system protein B
MSDAYPKLRNLEALPHVEGDRPVILLRDPRQISEDTLVVSPQVYHLLTLFNGANSVLDIQTVLTRQSGQIVFREQVESLVDHLDKAYFLDNENFRKRRADVVQEFHRQKVRPAHLAGESYPADENELRALLTSFYQSDEGAGQPEPRQKRIVRGLVAPHIDLRLGGPTYTHAYRRLAESEQPDLFVILGTGHMGVKDLFSVCIKDFETPLGTAEADVEFAECFQRTVGSESFSEELSHRNEHTIEFQLLFLQHLLTKDRFKIFPVLASFSYADLISPDRKKGACVEKVSKFVQALRDAEDSTGRRVCVLASVDLAHMGPRYGDSFTPDPSTVERVKAKDLEMLSYVTEGDAEGFSNFVASEQDRRKICGFPCLYTLLHYLESSTGELLAHSHCQIDATGSFVTYASLAFH